MILNSPNSQLERDSKRLEPVISSELCIETVVKPSTENSADDPCYPRCDPSCSPRCSPSCSPCFPYNKCHPDMGTGRAQLDFKQKAKES